MSIDPSRLQIVLYPDPVLRQQAARVPDVTNEVRQVAERMFELMAEADGVGLAAPQVGLPWRMFVTAGRDDVPPRVIINPELTAFEPELATIEEGCLSLPGVHVEVRRPRGVTLTAMDLDGTTFTLRDDEYEARVWQHEYDHLNGVLIIDKMSPMERLANRRILRDLRSGGRSD